MNDFCGQVKELQKELKETRKELTEEREEAAKVSYLFFTKMERLTMTHPPPPYLP